MMILVTEWASEPRPSSNILRLIYQGRFLHGNVTLAGIVEFCSRTTSRYWIFVSICFVLTVLLNQEKISVLHIFIVCYLWEIWVCKSRKSVADCLVNTHVGSFIFISSFFQCLKERIQAFRLDSGQAICCFCSHCSCCFFHSHSACLHFYPYFFSCLKLPIPLLAAKQAVMCLILPWRFWCNFQCIYGVFVFRDIHCFVCFIGISLFVSDYLCVCIFKVLRSFIIFNY